MKAKAHEIQVLPYGKILKAAEDSILLDVMREGGFFPYAPCGGHGSCGKCKVKLIFGAPRGVSPDENGYILSCKTIVNGDLTVELSQSGSIDSIIQLMPITEHGELYAALDLGTTTLAITLKNGRDNALAKATLQNPQATFGADVLSRIKACTKGHLDCLHRVIIEKTGETILKMSGGKRVKRLTVSANTTMLHIFLGIDPSPIGVYPFTPVFTKKQCKRGKELGLPADEICLLPSASAYIGSDVTSAAVFLGMNEGDECRLLVDIGTNGEILLVHSGHYYAASSAAGPALEGASIECGVGGIDGAICSISYKGGSLSLTTVNATPPRGICGSGLIDLIAVLVNEGVIDETGAFVPDSPSPLTERLVDGKFYLTDKIYLSDRDVRQFQLAKAAISAAIEALLAEVGITPTEVSHVYIAGGLGSYMSIENAVLTGLLPNSLKLKAHPVGNASLNGAELASESDAVVKKIERLAESIETVELSSSDHFRDKYMDNMYFSKR